MYLVFSRSASRIVHDRFALSQGQGTSYFSEEEQAQLLEQTSLTSKELQEIQRRYSSLDTAKSADETYGISAADILTIPEMSGCQLARLVVEKFGGKKQVLYPKEAVLVFGELSSHRDPDEKVDFLFDLLDVKQVGRLGGIEMYRFYHALLSPGLSDQQIKGVTENLMRQVGGEIAIEKFREIVPPWEIAEKMTVNIQHR